MLFQLVPGDFSYLNLNNSNSNWKREIIGIQKQPRKVRKLWFCKNCLLCFSYPRNVTDFLCCRFLCVASSIKKTRKWKPDLVLWSSPCLYKNAGALRFLCISFSSYEQPILRNTKINVTNLRCRKLFWNFLFKQLYWRFYVIFLLFKTFVL